MLHSSKKFPLKSLKNALGKVLFAKHRAKLDYPMTRAGQMLLPLVCVAALSGCQSTTSLQKESGSAYTSAAYNAKLQSFNHQLDQQFDKQLFNQQQQPSISELAKQNLLAALAEHLETDYYSVTQTRNVMTPYIGKNDIDANADSLLKTILKLVAYVADTDTDDDDDDYEDDDYDYDEYDTDDADELAEQQAFVREYLSTKMGVSEEELSEYGDASDDDNDESEEENEESVDFYSDDELEAVIAAAEIADAIKDAEEAAEAATKAVEAAEAAEEDIIDEEQALLDNAKLLAEDAVDEDEYDYDEDEYEDDEYEDDEYEASGGSGSIVNKLASGLPSKLDKYASSYQRMKAQENGEKSDKTIDFNQPSGIIGMLLKSIELTDEQIAARQFYSYDNTRTSSIQHFSRSNKTYQSVLNVNFASSTAKVSAQLPYAMDFKAGEIVFDADAFMPVIAAIAQDDMPLPDAMLNENQQRSHTINFHLPEKIQEALPSEVLYDGFYVGFKGALASLDAENYTPVDISHDAFAKRIGAKTAVKLDLNPKEMGQMLGQLIKHMSVHINQYLIDNPERYPEGSDARKVMDMWVSLQQDYQTRDIASLVQLIETIVPIEFSQVNYYYLDAQNNLIGTQKKGSVGGDINGYFIHSLVQTQFDKKLFKQNALYPLFVEDFHHNSPESIDGNQWFTESRQKDKLYDLAEDARWEYEMFADDEDEAEDEENEDVWDDLLDEDLDDSLNDDDSVDDDLDNELDADLLDELDEMTDTSELGLTTLLPAELPKRLEEDAEMTRKIYQNHVQQILK